MSLLVAVAGCSGEGGGSSEDCVGQPDGTACGTGAALICLAGACVTPGCGDGVVSVGEICDDGNQTPGDGCDPGCTRSCDDASDCDDAVACNGVETCSTTTNTCVAGTPTVCAASDACHVGVCEPSTGGCVEQLIDGDGDGQASENLGACGTDCDDGNTDVYSGATDRCGDGIDGNCSNGTADEVTTSFFADCDDDGFAAIGAITMTTCSEPASTAALTGCADDSGTWTTRSPNLPNSADCADLDPDARPDPLGTQVDFHDTMISSTSSWDWNCDGNDEHETVLSGAPMCRAILGCDPPACCEEGIGDWVAGPEPECGETASFEFCGDDLANAGFCPDDAPRLQKCR